MKLIDLLFKPKIAYAHCDIPCGIYDPHNAQMGAHTVIRMTQLISELEGDSHENEHKLARYTAVKEKHAELVEKEVVTLWSDYFKEEHFKANPNLTELVQQILKLTSKTRQNIDKEASEEMLSKTQELAEIFYKTKNRESKRVKSVYPTEGEIVVLA
ncbi:MAG TPA: superoxide dismutase, Ni [Candidatus Saccharimonadales bacterium]|nr:superoxide dismutase, Ni [Candidatus Saccharimonadales bacterium]